MRRERGMLSSLTKIKINLIASLLPWHDSCCESSNQKGKLIPQLLIKWYPCTAFDYIRERTIAAWLTSVSTTTLCCCWELGELREVPRLDLIFRACDSARWGTALANCRLMRLSLSKGSSIKTEVCSKLNSPFGAWFYCPQCEVQRNTRASSGLENKKEYENVAKMDAFLPVEQNDIFFKVGSSSF